MTTVQLHFWTYMELINMAVNSQILWTARSGKQECSYSTWGAPTMYMHKEKWAQQAFGVLVQAEMGAAVFNSPLAQAMLDTEQPFYRLGTGSSFHLLNKSSGFMGSLWY